MKETLINIKWFFIQISSKAQQYSTKLKGTSIQKFNTSNFEIISKENVLPLIINNYMLKLLQQYKEQSTSDYETTLKILNTADQKKRQQFNELLYEISQDISLIDKAIVQYQYEKKVLENVIQKTLGIASTKAAK